MEVLPMRTNIEIDDRLMRDAMRASGGKTKKTVVDAALRLLVQTKKQTAIRRLRGQVAWEGDLESSRTDRVSSAR
jgi:Arc/MetJ family transcription regulator/predicted nucleic acid-binding protein